MSFYTVDECNVILKAALAAFESQKSLEHGEAFVTSAPLEKSKEIVKKIVTFLSGSSDLPTLNLCMEFLLKLFYLDDEIKVQVALREYAPEGNIPFLSLVHSKPCDYTAPFISMFLQHVNKPNPSTTESNQPMSVVENLTKLFVSQVKLDPAIAQQLLEVWKDAPPPRPLSIILFKLSLSLLDLKLQQVVEGNNKGFETVAEAQKQMQLLLESLNRVVASLADKITVQNLTVDLRRLQTKVQTQEAQIKELEDKVTTLQNVRPATEVDLTKTTISGDGHELNVPAASATFTVNLYSSSREVVPQSTQYLTVKIASPKVKVYPQIVRNDDKGECKVTYEPAGTGILTIKVQYKGAHIPGSPFRVHVFSGKPAIPLANGGKPFGVVYARGLLYAVDIQNNKILEFPASGPPKEFKSGLNSPRGLSVTPTGELFIADGWNNKVIMLGADGKEKLAVGSKGIMDSQFAVPRFVLPLPDESFVVCDTDNSRLQFFSKTGQFLRKIGSEGPGPLEFKFPLGAAVNPLNPSEIAIADCDNNRVQFIHLTKGYVGEYGSTPAHIPGIKTLLNVSISSPNSVLYDKEGNLYVSELKGHCVRVFSPERALVKTLGKQGSGVLELKSPRSLAWSPEGILCIADHDNNRIQFF